MNFPRCVLASWLIPSVMCLDLERDLWELLFLISLLFFPAFWVCHLYSLLLSSHHPYNTMAHNISCFHSAYATLASVFLSFGPKQPVSLIMSILVFPQINQFYSISILYHCQRQPYYLCLFKCSLFGSTFRLLPDCYFYSFPRDNIS